MKRELIATALLLVIFAMSLVNVRSIENKMSSLREDIKSAESFSALGEREEAEAVVKASMQRWKDWGKYPLIMLRHSEMEAVTVAYFALLLELQRSEGAPSAAFKALKDILSSLAEKERISLGTIF